jgi:hypothetical protein
MHSGTTGTQYLLDKRPGYAPFGRRMTSVDILQRTSTAIFLHACFRSGTAYWFFIASASRAMISPSLLKAFCA